MTDTSATSNTASDNSAMQDISNSMTDLLPPELVAAVNKNKTTEVVTEKVEAKAAPAAVDVKPEEVVKSVDVKDNVDDVNIDNIDELIEGKVTAKATEDTEEVPDWHETDDYKNLVKKVGFVNGIKNEDFDKVIKSVVDKKIIESETYKNGLEEKLTKAKQTEDSLKEEIERLKSIEKDAFFDNLPETTEKYAKPMNDAATQMKQLLDINGVNVDINKILLSKNLTEFNNLLKNENLDDEDSTKIKNLWRNYRDSFVQYDAAKIDARNNLKKHMSSDIPIDTVKKIMGNTIAEAMKKDPRFEYIKNGISQDEYPEEVTKVISRANQNFANITQALSNPHDSSRNGAWLNSLAAFTLDASHNANEAAKVPEITKQLESKVNDLKKLAVAYTKLMQSAKGINGANGIARINGNSNGTSDDGASKEKKVAELQKIIDGTGEIDKFLGFK